MVSLPKSVLVFTMRVSGRAPDHYGVDVFQVREVLEAPTVTRVPGMAWAVTGLISLRGKFLPVVDLAQLLGGAADAAHSIMLVTDVGERAVAFLVDSVDTIINLAGLAVSSPPQVLASGYMEAIARDSNGRLIQILNLPHLIEGKLSATLE